MYEYFCKLSLGLKFGEFYFGFTGYNMPMIKAIEDIHFFLLNMAFISSSEVKNIYIS